MTRLALFCMLALYSSCNQHSDNTTDPVYSNQEVITYIETLYGGTGGLTVGADGNIYVSDFGPLLSGVENLNPLNRVFRILPDQTIEVFATGFHGASGSKFDSKGNFYQSNVRKGYVTKIDLNGVIDSVFIGNLTSPVGISLDQDENIYINNCGSHKIVRVDQSGNRTDFCTDSLLNCPNGLTRDENGNFYASNFIDGNVVKISPEGNANLFASIPGNNNGHIIFFDNHLYVIARSAHQIYKISMDGTAEIFAGSGKRGRTDGSRLEASFSYPNDLDVSLDGKYLYINEISDTISDHRVLTPMTIRRIKMPD